MSGPDRPIRFSADDPCPICGGWDRQARGQGRRCFGFYSADRKWAHCTREEYAGGLPQDTAQTYAHRLEGECKCGKTHGEAGAEPRGGKKPPRGRLSKVYDYTDEDGEVLFQVCRYVDPKGFLQRRPDGRGGWAWGVKGVRLVPYNLPEILTAPAGTTIYVVEGEKDADRLGVLGLVATTAPMGAGKWRPEFSEHFAGRDVVILPDNDDEGRKHAAQVAGELAGVAASVKVIDLARCAARFRLPELPPKGDVSDWLAAGGTRDDLDFIEERTDPEPKGVPKPPPHGECVLVRLDTVVSRPLEWLWKDRLPLGKLTLLAGDPGLGKSFLTVALAACVSAGGRWPDAPDVPVPRGRVIMLSAEDTLDDTVKPRLEAAEADLTRVEALTTMRLHDGKLSPFSLTRDLPALDDALARLGDTRLVVIDPVSAYLGGKDEHKNAEIREAIGPLSDLAGKYRVAVVLVTHLNKGNGSKAIYRSTGSLAFIAASRMAWLVIKDKDEPLRRLLLPAKSNLAADPTGMAYRIQDGAIRWEPEPIRMTADDALARESERGDNPNARGPVPVKTRAAMDWILGQLEKAEFRLSHLWHAAEEAGHNKKTFFNALGCLDAQIQRYDSDGRKMVRLNPDLGFDE